MAATSSCAVAYGGQAIPGWTKRNAGAWFLILWTRAAKSASRRMLRPAFERDRARLIAGLATVVERMHAARDKGQTRDYLAEDTAYHNVFFQCCGNRLFVETYDLMQTKIAALRTHLSVKPSHTDKSYAEHIELLDQLREGDIDAAIACLNIHIDRTRTTYSLTTEDICRISNAGIAYLELVDPRPPAGALPGSGRLYAPQRPPSYSRRHIHWSLWRSCLEGSN
jgi:hypothetical protein